MSMSLVTVSVAQIAYLSGNIGRDLSFDLSLGEASTSFNRRLPAGQTVNLSQPMGQFTVAAGPLPLSGFARVVERDPVYSEAGQSPIAWTLDAQVDGAQQTSVQVAVFEQGGHNEGESAIFRITLRADVLATTRFVPETEDGWLRVRSSATNKIFSLPSTTEVQVTEISNGREHFFIKEGAYRGTRASVQNAGGRLSLFSAADPRLPTARLQYSTGKRLVTVKGQVFRAVDDPQTPWTNGLYDVELPDAPHGGGLHYSDARKGRTWFRIGHRGDRYLHTGSASLGCITISEQKRWDLLYSLLSPCRKGDGVSVGVLEVVA